MTAKIRIAFAEVAASVDSTDLQVSITAKDIRSSIGYADVQASVSAQFANAITHSVFPTAAISAIQLEAFAELDPDTLNRYLADRFGMSDVLSRAVTYNRSFSDSLSMSDELTAQVYPPIPVNESDVTSITEQLASTISKSLGDAFTLDDFVDVDGFIKDTQATKTNVFSVSELHAMSIEKQLTDFVPMSESVSIQLISGARSVINKNVLNTFTLNS